MLIEIDGSAIGDALAGSARTRECIENLLHAHQAGKHVVWLDRAQIRALEPIKQALSGRAQGALRSIRSQQTEILGLRDRVRWIVRSGLGPRFDGGEATEVGKQVIRVPLHHFHDYERLGRAVMLGENLTDADLYVTMGRAFAAAHNWRVEPAFELQLGGGGTTASVFGQLVNDGRIVLAIVDSDQTYPGGPIGGTAAKVLPVRRSALQHVHLLHVRFAENQITSAVYLQSFQDPQRPLSAGAQRNKLNALAELMQKEAMPSAHAWRAHAELKHGIKLFEVRALAAGSLEAAFWSGVAADLGRDKCQQAQACTKIKDCRCYVTDALGEDALRLAVAWLAPRDPRRNARLLGIEAGTASGELCEKVLAWGLAPAARPA
jgi:hypothetical protein